VEDHFQAPDFSLQQEMSLGTTGWIPSRNGQAILRLILSHKHKGVFVLLLAKTIQNPARN
jgi:hypothetical protein